MSMFLSFRKLPVGGGTLTDPIAWNSTNDFKLRRVDISKLTGVVAGQEILFAVHGYNNSQSEAVCTLSRFEHVLKLPPNIVFVGILWPGDSKAGFISYPVEKPTASDVGRYLAKFCNRKLARAASISFVSHSLGARVVLETIRGLERETRSACLLAAAIERTCLEKEYADSFSKTDSVHVLASREDEVLRFAFLAGNLFGHALDPTAVPLSSALGYAGPRKPIGKTLPPWSIADNEKYDHGDYLPPSDISAQFPNNAGSWNNPASFVKRALNGERQTWPAPTAVK
ncbi:alpha/beta hydrolase [Sinorhizobium fredii]|uniref:Hydrolase-like protein n=1 Tax=Rhizobium fredii TaxID=380 RepID=A0A2L0HA12_RHIFR|nr:alpha/beta hydrolase [Sinorhizobium fredii]AUX78336.1 hydrolase-like protein [Sinorhizobium fredii]